MTPPGRAAASLALVRAAVGGVLMGIANLVPGISGGTMLLAVGVYPAFVAALAELTTLRLRPGSLLLVGSVVGGGLLAILALAGPVRALVVDQRWVMYSLFIGLTLGGVPLVLRVAGRLSGAILCGAAAGLVAMVAVGFAGVPAGARAGGGHVLLGLAGIVGASAMILPGISGGYLLLLLGQYERILGAVDQVKRGALAADPAQLLAALDIVVPVGIGVLVGIALVSNLVRWLLERFEKPTLGVLLGLLLGAAVGLWPFQHGVEPRPGERMDGRVLSGAEVALLDPADWPVVPFRPGAAQVLAALGLIGLGFGATLLVDRLSARLERTRS